MEWGFAGPKGVGMGQENFPLHAGQGREWGKTKPCRIRAKTSSFRPAPPHCHLCASTTNTTAPIDNESMTQRNGKGRYTREWQRENIFSFELLFVDFGKCFLLTTIFYASNVRKMLKILSRTYFSLKKIKRNNECIFIKFLTNTL